MGATLQRHAIASGVALILTLPLIWWIRPLTSGGVGLLVAIVVACVNLVALIGAHIYKALFRHRVSNNGKHLSSGAKKNA